MKDKENSPLNINRKFIDLRKEEKEIFILSIITHKIDSEAKNKKKSYKALSLFAESNLNVEIAPSTLGNILRKGSYRSYLLDRAGIDERFRKEYVKDEIEILKLIPPNPDYESSPLYEAWEKGISTERAKEIIDNLEFDGLIEQKPEAYGYPYYNLHRTLLGKKLIKGINIGKYVLNNFSKKYVQKSINK